MALDLANFSATGTIHLQARITAGYLLRANGQENIWSSSAWTADAVRGTLDDGSMTTTGLTTNFTLRRWAKSDVGGDPGDQIILNSVTTGLDLWSSGTTYKFTVVHEASGGTVTMQTADMSAANGTSWVRWERGTDGPLWDLVDAIPSGDSVILAIHQGDASYSSGTPSETRNLYLGDTALSEVYLGDAPVSVYLGDTLIHS